MNISILGCGWLGFPIAQHLINEDHHVKGSTTSPEKLKILKQAGIEPYHIEIDHEINCDDCDAFWNSELLFINIPPGRRDPNVIKRHIKQIKVLIEKIKQSPIQKVVFASSTSVYPNNGDIVSETDAGNATRKSGKALVQAERLLMQQDDFETTIIRFGGLYGYDRHPAKYLSGKKQLKRGNALVNLIHRDDAVEIVSQVIEKNVMGEIFNACSDGHPPRKELYTSVARHMELEPPTFVDDPDKETQYKIVSNKKLKEELNYRFRYPNPMDNTH